MTNVQIAAVFDQIADILDFQGANPFRIRAYRNAARTIHEYPEQLSAIAADPARKLTEIDGIGADLSAKIVVLLATGSLPQLVELQAQVPASVLALLRIPGLGPKKAAALHRELGIKSLEELRVACNEHRVRAMKGFGEKTEATIMKGLEHAEHSGRRMQWADADRYAQALREHLKDVPGLDKIELAGSYRRGKETIGDLDILVTSSEPEAVMDRFGTFDPAADVLARGGTKMSIRLATGLQVDLRVVPAESFGAALQYFTGSKEHNVILRGRAKDKGLKINEYGVFRGDEFVGGTTEEEIYESVELPWIPPELREARREFEWIEEGGLPKLIELGDLRGDLHMHTTETDGTATLEEMVKAAQARGLKYIAITDHSKRVSMANGLDGKRLLKQWEQIDTLNSKLKGFTVLKGCEVDILEKGGLDIEDEVLAQSDWIMASIHYGQQQPMEQIMKRLLEAIAHPSVSAISHPTGRLINSRPPYEIDLDAVIEAAKKYGKCLELNSHPHRLDLDDVACASAKNADVLIVISTDAHSTEGLAAMRYGVLQARRAGLTKEDVANTRTWPQLKKLIGKGK